MDRHVHEDAAGDLHIGERRSLGVTAGDLHDVYIADAARLHDVVHVLEVAIKAAVEAHLIADAGLLDLLQHRADLVDVVVYGLFAEDVLARLGCLH